MSLQPVDVQGAANALPAIATRLIRVGAFEDLGEIGLRLGDRAIDVIAEDRALDQVEEWDRCG
jgi:hypothetical protein